MSKGKVEPVNRPDETSYEQMLRRAGIFDYPPSKGCIVLRPYGYAIWQIVQDVLGERLRQQADAKDVYFPALIPEELIRRETAHIQGFAPELLRVTIGGEETGLVLRPTSEAIIYASFAKWIGSYRDLPLAVNQWCSVFRAEKRTYPFLRTREFLWQETHAVHPNHQCADEYVGKVLDIYLQFMEEYLAISAVPGKKTESEKFPGAFYTTALEAMPRMKALQVGTSHNLGTDFAKVYKVQFLDEDNKRRYPVITSHGVSWRILGAMFLSHYDRRGLILPPKMAPIQVLIIPVLDNKETELAIAKADELARDLKECGLRTEVDRREDKGLGFKYTEAEERGIPLVVTIGGRELENKSFSLTRRDLSEEDSERRISISFDNAPTGVLKVLSKIQEALLEESKTHLRRNITPVDTVQELEELLKIKGGFGAVFLCNRRECEARLKEIQASARCIPFSGEEEKGRCIYCGRPSAYEKRVLVAKAY